MLSDECLEFALPLGSCIVALYSVPVPTQQGEGWHLPQWGVLVSVWGPGSVQTGSQHLGELGVDYQ